MQTAVLPRRSRESPTCRITGRATCRQCWLVAAGPAVNKAATSVLLKYLGFMTFVWTAMYMHGICSSVNMFVFLNRVVFHRSRNDSEWTVRLCAFRVIKNTLTYMNAGSIKYVDVIKYFKNVFFYSQTFHCFVWFQATTAKYEVCSKKDRTFAIKTLLLILQRFKHCPPQSSPLYWQYTVPNVSSIFWMPPGTHLIRWRAVQLSHFPESPLLFGNDILSEWF